MTISSKEREVARERNQRLFEYMAAIQRLNTPPKLHVDDYPLVIRLSELPKDPAIKIGSMPLRGEGAEGDADFVLKVTRPAEPGCPAIPAALNGWLKPGFDKA